jgi:hypothetical protein
MARPCVSGSSSSMTIISPWAKVENNAIAVPSGITRARRHIANSDFGPACLLARYISVELQWHSDDLRLRHAGCRSDLCDYKSCEDIRKTRRYADIFTG